MDDILQTLDDVIKYTKNILCYKLFISILYGNTLNWAKRKQSNIALSSPEVEYNSLTETWQEMQWIQYLLQDIFILSKTIPIMKITKADCYS